jgi:predicted kinase
VDTPPTLFLTVGLPGVGKTTRAKELAAAHRILRLTPDDWMAPLFGQSDAEGRRDILEGRMIWVAHEVLVSGSGVILDFGCWSPEERYAIRAIAQAAGGGFVLEYVHASEEERRRRATARWLEAPDTTFEMTDADHDRFLESIRLPTLEELENGPIPPPPQGHSTWAQWASWRWPTLPVLA